MRIVDHLATATASSRRVSSRLRVAGTAGVLAVVTMTTASAGASAIGAPSSPTSAEEASERAARMVRLNDPLGDVLRNRKRTDVERTADLDMRAVWATRDGAVVDYILKVEDLKATHVDGNRRGNFVTRALTVRLHLETATGRKRVATIAYDVAEGSRFPRVRFSNGRVASCDSSVDDGDDANDATAGFDTFREIVGFVVPRDCFGSRYVRVRISALTEWRDDGATFTDWSFPRRAGQPENVSAPLPIR